GLLERGRERLRARLVRRGLTLSGAGAAVLADPAPGAPVPPSLAAAAGQAALRLVAGEALTACGVSASVCRLTEGGLPMLGSKKLVIFRARALGVGAAGRGAGLRAQRAAGPAAPAAAETPPSPPARAAAPVGEKRPPAQGVADGIRPAPVLNEG